MHDRAAQFSPFAALTGYGDAVEETARLTDEKIELDEMQQSILDRKQQVLLDALADHEQPEISVVYFQKDEKKAGGKYLTATGNLKKIDEYGQNIVFISEKKISFDDIFDISCDLFGNLFDY